MKIAYLGVCLLVLLLALPELNCQTPETLLYYASSKTTSTDVGTEENPFKSLDKVIENLSTQKDAVVLVLLETGASLGLVINKIWNVPSTITKLTIRGRNNNEKTVKSLIFTPSGGVVLNNTKLELDNLEILAQGKLNNSVFFKSNAEISINADYFTTIKDILVNLEENKIIPSRVFELTNANIVINSRFCNSLTIFNVSNITIAHLFNSNIKVVVENSCIFQVERVFNSVVPLVVASNNTEANPFVVDSPKYIDCTPQLYVISDCKIVNFKRATFDNGITYQGSHYLISLRRNEKVSITNIVTVRYKNIRLIEAIENQAISISRVFISNLNLTDSPLVFRDNQLVEITSLELTGNTITSNVSGLVHFERTLFTFSSVFKCVSNVGQLGPCFTANNNGLKSNPNIEELNKRSSWLLGTITGNQALVDGGAFVLVFSQNQTINEFLKKAFSADLKSLTSINALTIKDNKVGSEARDYSTGNTWDISLDLNLHSDNANAIRVNEKGLLSIENLTTAKTIFQNLTLKVFDQFGRKPVPDRKSVV